MYYVLRYYIKLDTTSGAVLQKRCSRISKRVSKNLFLKLNFFTDIFQGFCHSYYNNSLKCAANRTFFP